MQGPTPGEHEATNAGSHDDWAGIVDVLYTVRCNLLKAGKSTSEGRDLRVVRAASELVTIVAERLVEPGELD